MKDKTKLIISLLKLVRPFLMIMLLAIILGVFLSFSLFVK